MYLFAEKRLVNFDGHMKITKEDIYSDWISLKFAIPVGEGLYSSFYASISSMYNYQSRE